MGELGWRHPVRCPCRRGIRVQAECGAKMHAEYGSCFSSRSAGGRGQGCPRRASHSAPAPEGRPACGGALGRSHGPAASQSRRKGWKPVVKSANAEPGWRGPPAPPVVGSFYFKGTRFHLINSFPGENILFPALRGPPGLPARRARESGLA